MPICKNCGEPIYQTRGGSWAHTDGSGICSWSELGIDIVTSREKQVL